MIMKFFSRLFAIAIILCPTVVLADLYQGVISDGHAHFKGEQVWPDETIEAMDALIDWLPGKLPEEVRPIIVHGDYRLGNLILHPSEPRIIAILDWELSTLGDGLADLSYWCQEYYLDALVEEGLSNANLHSLGIPTEKEVINSYCEVAGRETIENWDFYIIYNMFRMAGIAQGVYKRGLDGNASSGNALEYAEVARKCAECGWKLLQKGSS